MRCSKRCRSTRAAITQDDWTSYPILTMADIPEIKVVLLHNPKVGSLRRRFGGGECARGAGHRSGVARRDRKDHAAASDEARLCAGGFESIAEHQPFEVFFAMQLRLGTKTARIGSLLVL